MNNFFIFGMEPHSTLRIPYRAFFHKSIPEEWRPLAPQLNEILGTAMGDFASIHPDFMGSFMRDGRIYGFRKQENVSEVTIYNARILDTEGAIPMPLCDFEEVGKLQPCYNALVDVFDVQIVRNPQYVRDNCAWNGELLTVLALHVKEKLSYCGAEQMKNMFVEFAQTTFPTLWKLREPDLKLFDGIQELFSEPTQSPRGALAEVENERFLFITTTANADRVMKYHDDMLALLGPTNFKAEWIFKEVDPADTFLHTVIMVKVFNAIQHSFSAFKKQRTAQLKAEAQVDIRKILSDEEISEVNNNLRVSGGIMLRCWAQFEPLLLPALRARIAPLIAEVRSEHGKLRTDA